MKRFVRRAGAQAGFTLIELIAAISLFTIVAGIVGTVTMFGFRSYHQIAIENTLRDEADLLMSSIITELYTYGPEEIQNTEFGIRLMKNGSDPVLIQMNGEQMQVGGQTAGRDTGGALNLHSSLLGSSISVLPAEHRMRDTYTRYESGLISIQLKLRYAGSSEDELDVTSQFGF
ncbi:type II secretion system protein [Paenibacillus spiritus]|uniref:Type II secretion system protein n=1 Tax=Paenibacillus spiritus TaxID=2496557 RepID=A0A5J5FWN2_9BACL|nr:type II secretion system protein [Paenibacillus spiritus]KAA8997951.1 type II secretion system protein [Paenibacillus spiritus]